MAKLKPRLYLASGRLDFMVDESFILIEIYASSCLFRMTLPVSLSITFFFDILYCVVS